MLKCIINALNFYFFSRIMQGQGIITNYIELLNKDIKNTKFLNLEKKINIFLNSLELKNKDIVLAVS